MSDDDEGPESQIRLARQPLPRAEWDPIFCELADATTHLASSWRVFADAPHRLYLRVKLCNGEAEWMWFFPNLSDGIRDAMNQDPKTRVDIVASLQHNVESKVFWREVERDLKPHPREQGRA